MTEDNTLEGTSPLAPAEGAAPPGAEQEQVVNPLLVAYKALRGRWLWAFGIGGVLGAGAAVVGWRMTVPEFQTAAVFEVAPKVPRVLYASDENGLLPMFDAFVEAQIALASSRRCTDLATDSTKWRELVASRPDIPPMIIPAKVAVSRPVRGQFVQIAYTDTDPVVAMTAANAVMEGYLKLVRDHEKKVDTDTITFLENKRTTLNNQLSDLRAEVQTVTDDLGAAGLNDVYRTALGQLTAVESDRNALNLRIAKLQSAADPKAPSDPAPASGHVPDTAELALGDAALNGLLQQRDDLDRQIRYLREVQHLGTAEPTVARAMLDRDAIERRIADRVQALRTTQAATPAAGNASLETLLAERARVEAVRDKAEEEVKRLGKKLARLADLEAERTVLNERLDEVRQRLEQINVESAVHGRITQISEADLPTSPSRDRRASYAVMGALLGLVSGFGGVLAWGLRDASMRHADDVPGHGGDGQFLGILPDLDSQERVAGFDEAADLADYCVHHVRTMVQIQTRNSGRALVVTSPMPASGKTTLSMALGASFAASGSRTLIVDCDLVGHGLTSLMRSLTCELASRAIVGSVDDASPASGRISESLTVRRASYDDAQVAELLTAARDMAQAGDTRCAQVAQALEALLRPTSGSRASTAQHRGILAALGGTPIDDCVVPSGTPNLWVLPVGDARAGDAERLSHEALQQLVSACRQKYDTVVIDTGPILGSIEAALVSTVADAAIVVVSRGQPRGLVSEALARLRRIGATVAGLVYNRATTDEVVRSSYVSRSKSVPAEVA